MSPLYKILFGILYETEAGVYDSQYYKNLNVDASVSYDWIFSVSYQGLGLPTPLWAEFVHLLNFVTNYEQDCSQGGICVLPNSCNNYYDLLWNYNFQITTVDGNLSNYFRLPIMVLALNGTNNATCNLHVQELDTADGNVATNKVIFGGLVFTEFYGKF